MSRWWRAYDEAVDDPKLQQLSAVLFRAWFNICCLTSKNGGILPSRSVIAFKLRCSEEKAGAIIEQLRDAQLIDEVDSDGTVDLAPHNWKGRQFQSDTSTPRVKRFRGQQRNVSSGVSVTPPETEADTETKSETEKEGGKNARRRACVWPFDEFWEVFPNKVGKEQARKSFEKIEQSKAVDYQSLITAARVYASKTDDRPWCNPGTWLNQHRWTDQPAEQQRNGLLGALNKFESRFDDFEGGPDDLLRLPSR